MLKAVLRTPRMYSKYRAAQFKEKELSDLETIKKQQMEQQEFDDGTEDFYLNLARYTAGKTSGSSGEEDNIRVNSTSTLEARGNSDTKPIQYCQSKKFLKNQ